MQRPWSGEEPGEEMQVKAGQLWQDHGYGTEPESPLPADPPGRSKEVV